MILDKWQEGVMDTKGNMCLRSGRQVGKSTVIALKAAKYAIENDDHLIMVISKTERQAGLLFSKILFNIHQLTKKTIKIKDKKGKVSEKVITAMKEGLNRPTKQRILLKNEAKVYCLPAGDTGYGIMGFTIDLLIADEAAFIPEEVWNSIIPAMAITRGSIWLLSTPFLKQGYYYDCFEDPDFTTFHTSSEDCPRKDEVFLKRRKETLTKAQYAQMYLGEFVDEFTRFFPEELVMKCCVLERRKIFKQGKYYLGCDVGRKIDAFTIEIIDEIRKEYYEQVENIMRYDKPIPETTREIIALNFQYNFKKEYIDSGGMGIAVCDILREDENNKRKVVEINNASRPYDKEERTKKILKEDLYNNLKRLMQQGKIKLLDDDEVKASLRCIQKEYNETTGRIKIGGNESHVVEGLIRGVWGARDKSLNPCIV